MQKMKHKDITPIRKALIYFHDPNSVLPKSNEPILLAITYMKNKVIYSIAHYNQLLGGYMLHNIPGISPVKPEEEYLLGWAYLSDFDSIALYNN